MGNITRHFLFISTAFFISMYAAEDRKVAHAKQTLKRKADEQLQRRTPKKGKMILPQNEGLPLEVWAHVLLFLKNDLEPGMQDWLAFSRTSKALNSVSQKWLKGQVKKEYPLFKQVMKILTIAKDVSEKSIVEKEIYSVRFGPDDWPGSNSFYSQTKSGLFLYMGSSYPCSLATPWGKIAIYGSGSANGGGFTALTRRFLQHVSLTFSEIPFPHQASYDHDKVKYYAVNIPTYLLPTHKPYQAGNRIMNPTPATLAAYEGQPVMVYSSMCGYEPTFELHALDGELLPKPQLKQYYKDYRSYGATNQIWTLLENMYRQEMAQNMAKDNDKCSICLTALGQGARVALQCYHSFHQSCVTPWLTTKSTCPNCRKPHKGAFTPVEKAESQGDMAGEGGSAVEDEE